jgi:hypothetical protein
VLGLWNGITRGAVDWERTGAGIRAEREDAGGVLCGDWGAFSRLEYHARRERKRARETAKLVRLENAEANRRAGLRIELGEGLEIEVERKLD